jgi:hypothetical protein
MSLSVLDTDIGLGATPLVESPSSASDLALLSPVAGVGMYGRILLLFTVIRLWLV